MDAYLAAFSITADLEMIALDADLTPGLTDGHNYCGLANNWRSVYYKSGYWNH
jgi:hypothetical protein